MIYWIIFQFKTIRANKKKLLLFVMNILILNFYDTRTRKYIARARTRKNFKTKKASARTRAKEI